MSDTYAGREVKFPKLLKRIMQGQKSLRDNEMTKLDFYFYLEDAL